MMNEILIPIVAIVTPFLFAGWVIWTSIRAKERKKGMRSSQESEQLKSDRELERDLLNLAKRIENLEIILRSRNNNHKE